MRLLAVRLQNLNSLSGTHEVRFDVAPLAAAGVGVDYGADWRGSVLECGGCDAAFELPLIYDDSLCRRKRCRRCQMALASLPPHSRTLRAKAGLRHNGDHVSPIACAKRLCRPSVVMNSAA